MNTTGRRVRGSIVFILLVVLAACVLFGGYSTTTDAPAWLRIVGIEIQAACRDAGTQWMVVVCLVSYFVVFLFLEKRSKVQSSSCKPESESEAQSAKTPSSKRHHSISYLLTPISSPVFWLLAFVTLVLIRYAFDYTDAARSLQVVVLLTGIVIGKGIAFYANRVLAMGDRREEVGSGSPLPAVGATSSGCATFSPSDAEKGSGAQGLTRPTMILGIIVFLLAGAALWQPERGMEFQYRGQRRWTGVWDNPNTYGVLMGTGLTLALGLLGSRGKRPTSNVQHSTSNEVGRVTPCAPGMGGAEPSTFNFQHATTPKLSCSSCVSRLKRILPIVILLTAAGVCAYALIKSYSRGAWLGAAVGIGYLIWKWINREPREIHEKLTREKPSTFNFQPATHRIWLPISVILASVLVLSFWQFRHTESPLLRRVFSVGNPNDFSWRNRVTAWQGAGRMMWDKPIMGFGWGKAEEIYSKDYRAARLEESAAVQLNDYLMIGISAGVPSLACFVAYLWLALSLRSNAQSLKLGEVGRVSPCAPGVEGVETIGQNSDLRLQTSVIAAGGAAVLLIGFWFGGGLFKLPTCVVFWVLLELCRSRGNEAQSEGRARHSVRAVGGESVLASQLVSSLAPPEEGSAQRTARPTIVLRWIAGIVALAALGMTTLHLGTPQLAVSERTLNIARKFIVPPKEKADFEYLAAEPIWSGIPLKTLLQHAHLANYNRTLVNWKLDDKLYREFVLSPEIGISSSTLSTIHDQPSTNPNWRRPLWEYFYPRIRKESSLEAAAEIVVRNLSETCRRRGNETNSTPPVIAYKSVSEIWQQQMASDAEFERICVAALRSVGIPARLSASGQAEFWNGAEWKPAPRPMVTGK